MDEPQFISPTDVAIVPESEGATSEPAEDMAIRLPDLAEPLPVMEEVVQLEQRASKGDQPTKVQQPERGLRRSTRLNRGVRTVPTFQMEQEAERDRSTHLRLCLSINSMTRKKCKLCLLLVTLILCTIIRPCGSLTQASS
jgi:hypothetical protein